MAEYVYVGANAADQFYILNAVVASTMTNKNLGVVHEESDGLRIVFDVSLSAGDEAILDAIVNDAQNLPLAEEMGRKIAALGVEITEFIEARYSQAVQSSLNFYMAEAESRGYVNRKVEIQKGIDWLTLCLDEYYTKKTDVLAATTVVGVLAVVLDLAGLDVADPGIDLKTIKNILN